MTPEQNESLGRLIDRLDNCTHALEIPIPANMHVDSLKSILPEIVSEFKKQFVEITGENPWEGQP